MKKHAVMAATFLIAVFAAATIFAILSSSQHPIALTEKSIASAQLDGRLSPTPRQ